MADLLRCSHCQGVTRYEDRSRVLPLGWFFFLIVAISSIVGNVLLHLDLLLYCGLPLSLLGLFFRERYRICPKCHARVAQLG